MMGRRGPVLAIFYVKLRPKLSAVLGPVSHPIKDSICSGRRGCSGLSPTHPFK